MASLREVKHMIKPDEQSATEIEASVIGASKETEALGSEVVDTNPLREELPPAYSEVEPPPAYSEIEPPPAYDEAVVTFTPVAAAKICELLEQESDPGLGLRIFVAGGGCSGLQYGMTLDEVAAEGDDTVNVFDRTGKYMQLDAEQKRNIDPRVGFKALVDSVSLSLVIHAEVDYVDSLMAAGFVVNNPNAVSSCGCGQSFKTESAGTPGSCGCGH